ncbi:uncharacterized protein PAE49_013023 isoform 1-T1 [Odontesthes bonariensis]
MDYRCFYVYCIFTSCLVAGQTPKYALVGQRIMFNADITTPPDEILWKHDGNKVVEFDGNQEQLFGSYTNRVVLNWHSADLEIDQLRFEDSGTYELEVFTKTVLDRSSYKLEVIDKVPEPTITCEMKKGSSSDESGNQATLTCSAELGQSPSLTKFQWSSNGNVQSGRNLTISLGDEHDNEVYTCTVSNPLTKESAVFTAKECYSDKDSSTALIVCILIPILLVGLAILIFILWRKGHFSKKTEEDLEKQADEIKGNHGFNGDEGRPLLDRAPTMPSHQPLHFVPRNNDPVALEQDTEEGQDMTPQKGFVKNRVRNIEETTQHIPAGQDKTPQKGFVKNRVRNIEETPQHIPAGQDMTPQKGFIKNRVRNIEETTQHIPAGQDKTPQKGFVKNRVRNIEETPRHIPAGSQKNEDNDRKTSSSSLVAEEPAPVLDRSQDLYEEEKQEANETLAEESDDQRSQKNEDNDRKTSSSSLVAEEPAPVLDRSQDLYEEEKQEANETLAEESDDQRNHGFNGDEGRPLLDRAPTMPSHQPLHFVPRNNDPVALEQDTEEGQDKTPQKGFVKNFVSKFEETPRHIPAGSQKNKHSDRRLLSPSSVDHSEISDGQHKDAKESFREELDDQSKLEAGVSARPPPPPKRPSVQNRAGKDKKLTDEDKSHEAEEEKDIKSDPSGSKKADDSLSGKLEAGVSARPPPPPKRPSVQNRAGKDKKLTDEDESHEAEEEKDIKSDPSDSKKADDSLSGQDKTPQKGFIKNFLSKIEETPRHIPAGSQKNKHSDRSLSSPSSVDHSEISDGEHKDAKESFQEELDDQSKLEAGVSARPPPPPKRPSVQNRAGKDKKLTDEDESHEAEEEKDIKSDPSDSKKADDSLSGKLEAGVSARPPPPPKRPSVPNRAGKDKKLTDEDESHEAEEEKDIKSDPSESKKADDSLSGKLEAGVSARPPPPPKRPSVPNRAGKDKKLTDEDESHEAEEEKDIESDPSDSKKADDSLSGQDKTPQKGIVKDFLSKFEETPRHIPAGSQKNKHSDRSLSSPSSVDHSEISDGEHKDAKESFREELDDQSKLEAGVSARPPPPPKRPSVQNRAGKDKKLTDEDKSHEAEEEKDIKSDPSDSKKADDSLSGKLEAGVSARPPPPPKRPSVQNRAGKDKKLTDEDGSHEAEEEKDIESDPSDSKKADDSLSGQDKTPQKGIVKDFLSKIEETPRHIPAGSQKNKHSDRRLLSPSYVDHSEISDGEHKDAKESFREELDDQSKLEAGVSARPPPPPKRPSVQNRAGKDKKLTDEDGSHEAEEEKDIESDPSDSKKADDSLSECDQEGDKDEDAEI